MSNKGRERQRRNMPKISVIGSQGVIACNIKSIERIYIKMATRKEELATLKC